MNRYYIRILIAVSLLLLCVFIAKKLYDRNNKTDFYTIHRIMQDNFYSNMETKKVDIPVYYINMDSSPDRKIFIEKQMEKLGAQFERISGVDSRNLNASGDVFNITQTKSVRFENNFSFDTISELGCTLAHIKAIYNAYTDGLDIALIAEDDVCFFGVGGWSQSLSKIASDAPSDWTIISLYSMRCMNNTSTYYKFTIKNPCYSTAAYIINRKGMQQVLSDILHTGKILLYKNENNNPDRIVADYLIYHRSSFPSGTVYAFTVPTVYTYNDTQTMDSTIHPLSTNTHILRVYPIVKKLLSNIQT